MENVKSALSQEHCRWLEENYSRMYAFSLSQLRERCAAEDAVSDAAAVIISKYSTMRGDFSPWAWGILRKIILRMRRAIMQQMCVEDIDAYAGFIADTDILPPAENLITAYERGQVRRILSMMPSDIRRVLEERYVSEKTYTEIADILEIPLSSVTWRLHEGRKQMRKEWDFMELDTYMKDGYYAPVDIKIDVRWRKKGRKSEMYSDGLKKYHDALGNLIAKNIAAVCYDSEKTVTDISRIMGVPAVYIEEVLAKLLDTDLIKQTANRYRTAFPIITKNLYLKLQSLTVRRCGYMYTKWAKELTKTANDSGFADSLSKTVNGESLTAEQRAYLLFFFSEGFGHADPFSDDGSMKYPHEHGDISLCVKAYGAEIEPESIFPIEHYFYDSINTAGERVELHFENSHNWFEYTEAEEVDRLSEKIQSGAEMAVMFSSRSDYSMAAEYGRRLAQMKYEDQLDVRGELISAALSLLPERFRAYEAYVNCELRNFILAGFEDYLIEHKVIAPAAYVIRHESKNDSEVSAADDDGFVTMY